MRQVALLIVSVCVTAVAGDSRWWDAWVPDSTSSVSRAVSCIVALGTIHSPFRDTSEFDWYSDRTAKIQALSEFRTRVLGVKDVIPADPTFLLSELDRLSAQQRAIVAARVAQIESDANTSAKGFVEILNLTEPKDAEDTLKLLAGTHRHLLDQLKLKPGFIRNYIADGVFYGIATEIVWRLVGDTSSIGPFLLGMASWNGWTLASHYYGRRASLWQTNPWIKLFEVFDEAWPHLARPDWAMASDNYPISAELIEKQLKNGGYPTLQDWANQRKVERSKRSGMAARLFLGDKDNDVVWVQSDFIAYRHPETGKPALLVAIRFADTKP